MSAAEDKRIRDRLAVVRANDAAHAAEMIIIAKRGGKTLAGLRALSMGAKDAFITKHAEAAE